MPFKVDPATGNIVVAEVNGQKLPVFVGADGKEAPFDGDATVSTISRLNAEAKGHREGKEAAEAALKPFKDAGLTDAAAAAAALATVKNLDDKKLVDAGEVEKVKTEAIKSLRESELAPVVRERDALKTELYNEKIGGAFARSKFIAEKLAIPADMAQAAFGGRFKIEGGKTIATDVNGQPIFSRSRHGEHADFEEALEIMVDSYPHKASILKASGASGSGASGSGNGSGSGKKVVTRAQFQAMSPAEQAAAATSKDTQIVD